MILAVSRLSLLASSLGEGERIKVRGFRALTLSALPRLNPHPPPLSAQGQATQARATHSTALHPPAVDWAAPLFVATK
jgi:hypothetical protein